jgi:tetratricopeptide (TPR) repeat protein
VSGTNIQAGRDVTIAGAGSIINRNRGLTIAITLGLCVIGTGIAYLVFRPASDKLDAPRIRAHLVESSERKRDEDLVAADRAATSSERERLRDEAEKANLARKARIDDLVGTFVTLEAKSSTTNDFREMTRILSEEGVDAALAYVDKRRADTLDRIQSRAAAEHEQNRVELQPLLKAAELRATKGENDEARSAYRQLLGLEPAWPDALLSYGGFLIDQSHQSQTHGTITAALSDSQEALAQAQLILDQDKSNPVGLRGVVVASVLSADNLSLRRLPGDADQAFKYYSRALDVSEGLLKNNPASDEAAEDLSATLNKFGDFLGGRAQPGDADQALKYYTRSLELSEGLLRSHPVSGDAARSVSFTLNRLGAFLSSRGQAGDGDQALKYYTRSLELSEGVLKSIPGSSESATDVSQTLDRLGDFLSKRGRAGDADQALRYYTRDLEISEGLLKRDPDSGEAARDVSVTLDKVGDLLSERGRTGDADQALKYYTRALDLSEGLLKRDPDSGRAAHDVSQTLDRLGNLLSERGQAGDADQALKYYTRDLELGEGLLKRDPDSGETAREVSIAFGKLGDFLSARGRPGDSDQALKYYTHCLELGEGLLKRDPDSGQTAHDVSVTLERLGDFLSSRGQAGDADQALKYYTRDLALGEALLKDDPDSSQEARDVYNTLLKLAKLALAQKHIEDAKSYLQRADEIKDSIPADAAGDAGP